jgi:hypothetical protein
MRERRTYKVSVTPEEFRGKQYFIAKIGRREYFKPAAILYVHPSLIKSGEVGFYVEFPCKADMRQTSQKDVYVLVPSTDTVTYYVYIKPGFRGMGLINSVSPPEARVIEYWDYESELGSLGRGTIAFIVVPKDVPIKIEWERTGRLYGSPSKGVTVYYPDGTVEELTRVDQSTLDEISKLLGGE